MECFGISGVKPDWSIQNKKSRVLISSTEVLAKMHKASSRALGKSAHPESL